MRVLIETEEPEMLLLFRDYAQRRCGGEGAACRRDACDALMAPLAMIAPVQFYRKHVLLIDQKIELGKGIAG